MRQSKPSSPSYMPPLITINQKLKPSSPQPINIDYLSSLPFPSETICPRMAEIEARQLSKTDQPLNPPAQLLQNRANIPVILPWKNSPDFQNIFGKFKHHFITIKSGFTAFNKSSSKYGEFVATDVSSQPEHFLARPSHSALLLYFSHCFFSIQKIQTRNSIFCEKSNPTSPYNSNPNPSPTAPSEVLPCILAQKPQIAQALSFSCFLRPILNQLLTHNIKLRKDQARMGKAFIEMRYRSKKFKLNADDIGKLYRICKRKTPAIPTFQDRSKIQMETDDDVENISCVNA